MVGGKVSAICWTLFPVAASSAPPAEILFLGTSPEVKLQLFGCSEQRNRRRENLVKEHGLLPLAVSISQWEQFTGGGRLDSINVG